MPSMNRVFLMGNLTRDPESRKLPSGQQVVEFGLAINRRYKTASGEDREDTCFVDISVWGKQADLCLEYLKKGSLAMVEGFLRFDQWESQGEKRSKLRVTADRVHFFFDKRDPEASTARHKSEPAAHIEQPAQKTVASDSGPAGEENGGDVASPF